MNTFDFSWFLGILSSQFPIWLVLANILAGISVIIISIPIEKRIDAQNPKPSIFSYVVIDVFCTIIYTFLLMIGATHVDKAYHNNNTVVFPTMTLIARNNSDEYTLQERHAKPVTFNLQNGDVKHKSLVDVSAEQVSDDENDEKSSTSTYFKRNSIVKLPLDKADDIQTGDRVTTAKKTLHVNYTGKKAFKLHVIKIERPVSADKTQWHIVYEAK